MSKAAVVLGPARSGTSLVTSMVHELGAYVEDDWIRPDKNNEAGYWESAELVRINKAILSSIGASEVYPPPLFSGWERDPRLDGIRTSVQGFVRRMDLQDFWVCKHPSMTITLPFWLPYLPEDRCFLVCVRNPLSVAYSRKSVGTYRPQKSSRLWTAYILAAIAGTAKEKRLFVHYEDLGDVQQASRAQIGEFLGVSASSSSQGTMYSESLHHQASSVAELVRHPDISWGTKLLYMMLLESKRDSDILARFTRTLSGTGETGVVPLWASNVDERVYEQYNQQLGHSSVRLGMALRRLFHSGKKR